MAQNQDGSRSGGRPPYKKKYDGAPSNSRSADGKPPYKKKFEGGGSYGQNAEGKPPYKKKFEGGGSYGQNAEGKPPYKKKYEGGGSYGQNAEGKPPYKKKYEGGGSYGQNAEGKPPYKKKYEGGGSYGQNAEGKPPYKKKYEGGGSYGQNAEGKPPYKKKFEGGGSYGQNAEGKPPYKKKYEGGGSYGQNAEGKPPYKKKYEGGGSYGQNAEGQAAPPRGQSDGDTGTYRRGYDATAAFTYEQRTAYERGEDMGVGPVKEIESDEQPFLLIGRNAVREAIKSGRSIDRVEALADPDGSLREILALARERALVVRSVERKRLDALCMPFGHGGKTANHQGIVAFAAGVAYCEVSDILAHAKERGEDPFVVVLDGVLDPHNLGSIIRSAECAGAHGVIFGKRRSASVTAATVKAAAGATEHIKIARVVNIARALDELKEAGLWIAGADMSGQPMDKQKLTGALAIVIGGEGEGLGKLVSEKCDFLVSIPLYGEIASLNAGVAAGVLLFEKRRQDHLA